MVGFSPKEFIDAHTGLEFNYKDLQLQFKRHCFDYMEDLKGDTKSLAIEFASKVIYEVGPESRKIKKVTGDKVWKFIFPNVDKTRRCSRPFFIFIVPSEVVFSRSSC